MKKLSILLLLAAIALTSRADVLIYKIKVTETITGHGQTLKVKTTGFLVTDPVNLTVAVIPIQSATFTIFEYNGTFAVVDAGRGRISTALSIPGDGTGAVMAVGLNSSLVTGTVTSYLAPKTAKVTGIEVLSDLVSTEVDSGTLIYDQVDTVTQNGLGGDFDTTVSDIEQTLLNEGLIEM